MNSNFKLRSKVKGQGNPILLVPGGLTGWKSWEPFIDIFSTGHRKVISVQLLNVEYAVESWELPDSYSVKTESQAFATTLDSLGYFDPLDLVAWSFGAFISLDFALGHPDRIRTLTLIEPPAIWILRKNGKIDAQFQHTINFLEKLYGNITDNMLEAFMKEVGLVRAGESPRNLPQWEQMLPFKQSLRNSQAVVNHDDDIERLHLIKSPVLLVKGTGSAPFLHKIIDILSLNLPDSRVIELPGGHAPHIVSRERFLSELESFQKSDHQNTSPVSQPQTT